MRLIFIMCCLVAASGLLSGCFEQKVEVGHGTAFLCNECKTVIREDTKRLFVPVSKEKDYRIEKNTLEICLSCALEREQKGNVYIMGNFSSKCYHDPDCSAAKRIKKVNRTYFKGVSYAKRAGYTACQICKP